MIKITLPDSSIKEIKKGSIALDIANGISPSLAKKTITSLQNGEVVDLITPIHKDVKLELITDPKDNIALSVLRHSTAHVLAKAILDLYPNAKLTIGPSIEEGFYYDIDFGETKFSSNDFSNVEKQMTRIVAGGSKFEKRETNEKEILNLFKDNEYKKELVKDLKGQPLSIYKMGDFEDLCKGPHLQSIGQIKHFKLTHISGAYFKGDSSNKQLTRIYGTAFFNKEELDIHLKLLSERKERDHRRIGKELGIYMMDPLGGKGFTFWLPSGLKIKEKMKELFKAIHIGKNYYEIESPIVGDKLLYETSGHLDHYEDTMFPKLEFDDEQLYLRPMSCPHHCLFYKNELKSYKDLPFRVSENVRQYRYEKSGALRGLERVRAMELTDSHIFITPEQIESETKEIIKIIQKTLKIFNIEIDYIELALRNKKDKEKYHNDDKMWDMSENKLREILKHTGIKYIETKGEAAFYGPKIDIQVKTTLGHSITMSTIQLDFLLPKRFNLSYKDSKGKNQVPVMIHRGLIGTYERFMSILLEQTKGYLPFWLSPRQVVIIPVNNDAHIKASEDILKELNNEGILNVVIDDKDERLSYKIRQHQMKKTNFQIVMGDKETKENKITYREYGSDKEITITKNKFIDMLKDLNKLPLH